MINTQKRAVGYVRVSTEEQAREGVSLEAQRERIRALAVAKGWDLDGAIQDRGFSGKDLNRPGVQDLIKRCQAGEVDVVIVYKVDRLTRKQKHLWHSWSTSWNRMASASSPSTSHSTPPQPQGRPFWECSGFFAQLERELIGECKREGLRQKKKKGEWVTRIPIGFRIGEGGKLEEDPEAMRLIKKVKRLSREGRSIRDIANALGLSKDTVHKWVRTDLRTLKCSYLNA